jgi:hypothetical protein
MTTPPLSPAARAVMAAANAEYCDQVENVVAAALRAVADQVAADTPEPNRCLNIEPERDVTFIGAWHIWNTTRKINAKLLAIANELNPQP